MGAPILGIDLGTTNSLVGVVDSGFPILLADATGSRLTPSAVHYPEDGAAPVVGAAALRLRALFPGRTVTSAKRHIGSSPPLCDAEPGASTPEQVSAEILRHLSGIAAQAMGEDIGRAVITVPAYFNDAQRSATRRAGELAGLEVVRIVSEPTAAALAYGLDRLDERSKVAVYDFGGGTFDVSVLELNEGVFQVLATDGDTRLGGDDIDLLLAEHLLSMAGGDELAQLDAAARVRLLEAAREAKEVLSEQQSAVVRLPFFGEGAGLEVEISRSEFEALARRIVDRTRGHCAQVLAAADLAADELDGVILVGGSTRIPLVRSTVQDIFGRQPDLSQNPDEAVALGAVIQAGVLSGALREMVLLDVTPLSLGVETFGGLMNVIIPRNTTIPVKRGELFTNAAAGQRSMKISVLQGEREMAGDNWQLGEFEIEFEPGPKGSARVGVQFELDADGILKVLARDTATGTDRVLELRDAAVDVDDERVEQMVSESVEHAFDDMNQRIRTEAVLKSEELLPAVESALAIAGDALDEAERSTIQARVEAVRAALEGGSATSLKRANAELDSATETLAALLVERALGGD